SSQQGIRAGFIPVLEQRRRERNEKGDPAVDRARATRDEAVDGRERDRYSQERRQPEGELTLAEQGHGDMAEHVIERRVIVRSGGEGAPDPGQTPQAGDFEGEYLVVGQRPPGGAGNTGKHQEQEKRKSLPNRPRVEPCVQQRCTLRPAIRGNENPVSQGRSIPRHWHDYRDSGRQGLSAGSRGSDRGYKGPAPRYLPRNRNGTATTAVNG